MIYAKVSFGTPKTYLYALPEKDTFNVGKTNIEIYIPKGIDRWGNEFYAKGTIVEICEIKSWVPTYVTKEFTLEAAQFGDKKILRANIKGFDSREARREAKEADRELKRKFLESIKF